MRKVFLPLLIGLMINLISFAQLTGIKNIPGDYASVAAAITALNTSGVGTGGVTFNIRHDYTETFVTATDGLITCANSLATNPIVFQKDGAGANPLITARTGSTGSTDYIFCIGGTDYVTFDGIDVRENPANTLVDNQMEWGYAILRASLTDGTKHAVIKNCSITLNKANALTAGIYCFRSLYSAPGTAVTVTSPDGANSNNGFYNLHISNCFQGMYLYGSAGANIDRGNDIGSLGGNVITDFNNTGASTPTFGCNAIFMNYQQNVIIANNNIYGTIDGPSCNAIQMQSTTNAVADIYGNTISIQYLGTSPFYGIKYWNSAATTSSLVSIHHNTITGCTFPNATSSTCTYIDLANGSSSAACYNNTVSNNTYGSLTADANGSVNYIDVGAYPGVLETVDVYNNTIANNVRLQNPSGPGGGTTHYLYVGYQCNVLNCYGNLVDNNSAGTNGSAVGISCHALQPVTKNIHDNIVSNLTNANGQTYGMYVNDGVNWNIYRNKVYNISGSSSTSAITGFLLGSHRTAGSVYFYNNIISDLKSNNASSLTGVLAVGFTSKYYGIFNNTIYLNATSGATNFGSTGLLVTSNIPICDLRNNIIVNNSTPNGTGKTTAILTDMLNFGNLALTSNNNNYYVSSPSANRVIFSDGVTDDQTLLQYKARLFPREYLSVNENPPFVSAPADLHMNTSEATQCESGGTAILDPMVISTDYDGDARYPYSGYPVNPSYPAKAPDIGADEFGGVPGDLLSPYIAYYPLPNTATSGSRVLTATITDVNGVPVSGDGLPRLCWKLNAGGSWTYVTGVSAGNNQYSFTLGDGAVLGDVVYYFLVAQDMWSTPNVGPQPFTGAGGYSINPPAAATPPTVPNSYQIVAPICGTFTVGTGGNYTTLPAAINDINSKGITCPITLILTSNLYDLGTTPLVLQPNGGSSSVNTLTIKPLAGKTPMIAANTSTGGVFKVNGFDYLIIDGSATGGTDQSITFYNYNTLGNHVIGLFNNGGSNPSTNITIKNCVIKGLRNDTVPTSGILLNSFGGGYDNVTITNNSIYAVNTGIQFTGSVTGSNHNGVITHNVIGSPLYADYIGAKGIRLKYSDNTLIENNDIMGFIDGTGVLQQAGVFIETGSTSTKIRRNLIHDFYRNVDDGSGAYGIWYEAESNTLTEISNNSIYGIKSSGAAPGAAPNNCYGIYISSGGNIKILYNSIYLYGDILSPELYRTGSSACLGIYQLSASTNNIEFKNNILMNSQKVLAGQPCGVTGRAYGIMTTANDPGNFSVIDYNNYFINGCQGSIAYTNTNKYELLPDWQAFTGQEAHSRVVNPLFTSQSNLVPTTTEMPKAGNYISLVPTDINNVLRTSPPDLGAYEFTPSPSVVTTAATDVLGTAATLNGTVNPISQNVNMYFDYGTTTAYGNEVPGTPFTCAGGTTQAVTTTVTGLAGGTTYHFRLRGISFTGVTSFGNDMTFTTATTVPVNTTVTGTVNEVTDTCFNATNTVTVAGTPTTFTVENGGSATLVAGVKISFLPGTIVASGGYMHGYISTGTYCNGAMGSPVIIASGQEETPVSMEQAYFSVYPNPTTGNFTIVQKGEKAYGNISVEVYSMHGAKVMTETMIGEKKHEFGFSNVPAGLYFVKVVADGYVETLKLVKL